MKGSLSVKPWPWNTLPDPTPADWGIGMTVCVAAYCSAADAWVCAADYLLSVGDMAAENLVFKMDAIGSNWIAMSAGNDMSPLRNILGAVHEEVKAKDDSLPTILDAFRKAYRAEITQAVETDLLSRFQMDMSEFKRDGNNIFGPEIFSRMVYQIQETELDLAFLVVGFDRGKERIFKVSTPGKITFYDSPGFWALGSGETAALSILFACKSPIVFKSLPAVVSKVAQAKFAAERVPGVGQLTSIVILKKTHTRMHILNDELHELRKAWEDVEIEDVPEGVLKASKGIVSAAKAVPRQRKKRKGKPAAQPSTSRKSEDHS
jgi:20S proteasome alpha/beta subunit